MAGIEILVIGVLAHVLAKRSTRIEIAHPLVIGEEVDTLAHPAGIGDVAVQMQQALKVAIAIGIAPQMPDEAPTVALPMREFAHVDIAPNHNAALRPIGNRVGLAERKLAWQSALGLHSEDDLEAGRELTGISGVQDLLSVGRPA